MTAPSPTVLYLAAVQPRSGKSLVALGILELLSRRIDDIGYFRPVVPHADDPRVALMRDRYRLGDRATYAWTDAEVDALLAQGKLEEVFKGVIGAYRTLADRCGFVLVEGTDQTGSRSALEFDFNARLANHLGASVVALVNGDGQTPTDVVESVRVSAEALSAEGVTTIAIVANRVADDDVDAVRELLESGEGDPTGVSADTRS